MIKSIAYMPPVKYKDKYTFWYLQTVLSMTFQIMQWQVRKLPSLKRRWTPQWNNFLVQSCRAP